MATRPNLAELAPGEALPSCRSRRGSGDNLL